MNWLNVCIVGWLRKKLRSWLVMRDLNLTVDGAETNCWGREFHIGTILEEKKMFSCVCFGVGDNKFERVTSGGSILRKGEKVKKVGYLIIIQTCLVEPDVIPPLIDVTWCYSVELVWSSTGPTSIPARPRKPSRSCCCCCYGVCACARW